MGRQESSIPPFKNMLRAITWPVVAGVALGAGTGVWRGIEDTDTGQVVKAEAITVDTVVEPSTTEVDFLNKQVFAELTGTVATRATLNHSWIWVSPEITIGAAKFPIILPLANAKTTRTYNYKLLEAKEKNIKPNPADIDSIKVEMGFEGNAKQTHTPNAKPWAERTESEKSLPPILSIEISGDKIRVVPIASNDPIGRARAFNGGVEASVPLWVLDSVGNIWSSMMEGNPTAQKYSDGAIKTADEVALAKANDVLATACTEAVLNDDVLLEHVNKFVAEIALENYNSTHQDKPIAIEDVGVKIVDVQNLTATNPWSVELRKNFEKSKVNAASNNGTFKEGKLIVDENDSIAKDTAKCNVSALKKPGDNNG